VQKRLLSRQRGKIRASIDWGGPKTRKWLPIRVGMLEKLVGEHTWMVMIEFSVEKKATDPEELRGRWRSMTIKGKGDYGE